MKTYRKGILPVVGISLLALTLLSADLPKANACEFASTNANFIKEQTQRAIDAEEFHMSKYFAYKALNGSYKTKENFYNCGCYEATDNLREVAEVLKNATRAMSHEHSKIFLNKALSISDRTIAALKKFRSEYGDTYYEDSLLQLSNEVLNRQDGVLMTQKDLLTEAIEDNLSEFENSLDQVVDHTDCEDAKNFIETVIQKSELQLSQDSSSKAKSYYHDRIKDIAQKAKLRLGNCDY